jgi:putative aldouronate transport system permease protein
MTANNHSRMLRKLPGFKRASAGDIAIDVFVYVSLLLLCVVTIYPFLNTLAYSFNNAIDSVRGGIYLWPRAFTLRNYEVILVGNPLISRALFNSATRALSGGILSVFSCLCVSYAFSRREFFLRKAFTPFLVFTMYFSGGIIPSFLLIRNLKLINNFLVYLLPTMISAYNVMVMRSFIENIPESLIEASRIDGASEYRILLKVVFPLCMPVVATIALFVVVSQWNAWIDTMLYCSSESKLTTLQYELQKLLTSAQSMASSDAMDAAANAGDAGKATITPTSIRTAMTIIAIIPILFIYPFLQRYFVSGLTIGGVKG